MEVFYKLLYLLELNKSYFFKNSQKSHPANIRLMILSLKVLFEPS